MKRISAIIVAFACLAIPALCPAEPFKPGSYVSVFVGGAAPLSQNVATDDYYYNQSFRDRVRFEPGVSVGAGGGYDFGYVRVEGELTYKHAEIDSITERNGGAGYRDIRGSVGAFAVLGNAFIELRNASRLTPYLGGGVGFATLYVSDTSGRLKGASGARVSLYDGDDDAVFAYQAGAGLEVAFNRHFSLDLGYRYFGTSRARFNDDSSRETGMKFQSHNGTVGLRFRF